MIVVYIKRLILQIIMLNKFIIRKNTHGFGNRYEL